jgi:predicted nucleic acid-binding protein
MKLLDTVVLIGAIREEDKHYEKARMHLDALRTEKDVYVPSSILLEFDLELKAHGYTPKERRLTWEEIVAKVSAHKVLPLTASAVAEVPELETELSYFDAIIVGMAKQLGACVVTTDKEIGSKVKACW